MAPCRNLSCIREAAECELGKPVSSFSTITTSVPACRFLHGTPALASFDHRLGCRSTNRINPFFTQVLVVSVPSQSQEVTRAGAEEGGGRERVTELLGLFVLPLCL